MLIDLLKILAERISEETPYRSRLTTTEYNWPNMKVFLADGIHFVIVPDNDYEYLRMFDWPNLNEIKKWGWGDIQDPTFNPNAVFDEIIKHLARK